MTRRNRRDGAEGTNLMNTRSEPQLVPLKSKYDEFAGWGPLPPPSLM